MISPQFFDVLVAQNYAQLNVSRLYLKLAPFYDTDRSFEEA
jgi:hypothetical protein